MSKIFAEFKKMPLLYRIAAIAFLAALAVLLFATLLGYIGDIFFFGIFKFMFTNVYGFFYVVLYFIQSILQIVFVAALVVAMVSGKKGNVSLVLLCKSVLISIGMFFVTPFLRILLVITEGWRGSIISGGAILSGLFSLLLMLALIALAVLLLGGFGRFKKLAALITTGVFSVVLIADFVYLIKALINSVKSFIQSDIPGGIFGLTATSVSYCASIIMVCGYIVLCLVPVFNSKGAFIPKKTSSES